MSTVNRSLRSASKQLRVPSRSLRLAAPLPASVARAVPRSSAAIPSSYSCFSTSIARRSAPNMPAASTRDYDPEINDIADYVANKPIDSELAVSFFTSLCRAPSFYLRAGDRVSSLRFSMNSRTDSMLLS
jgi:2-methylcitrate dehydratase